MIWHDRKGQFSPLKAATLAALCAPALWMLYRLGMGQMSGKPLNALLHETGLWALRLLLVTLAVTPFRSITGYNRLILVRRMLGLGALAYATVHFSLYIVDQNGILSKVAAEIVARFYLAIGFAALVAMAALGATSTDGAIRRLGALWWNRLHWLIYPLTLLALWHGALQSKIGVDQHVVMAGVFLALMGVRLLRKRIDLSALPLLVLAAAAAIAAAFIEFLWYHFATGLPAARILAANLDPALLPRPSAIVALIALSLPLAAIIFQRLPRGRASPARSG
jgi:methionine sulfoxide reductase heme-binding subunit